MAACGRDGSPERSRGGAGSRLQQRTRKRCIYVRQSEKAQSFSRFYFVFLLSFGCLCAFVSVGLSVYLQGSTTEEPKEGRKEGSRNHQVVLGEMPVNYCDRCDPCMNLC